MFEYEMKVKAYLKSENGALTVFHLQDILNRLTKDSDVQLILVDSKVEEA